jgi:periplasmic nitrate reductase NapE
MAKLPVLETDNALRAERRIFVFLAFVVAPILAVCAVGAYGFLVWLYQIFAGPPGA